MAYSFKAKLTLACVPAGEGEGHHLFDHQGAEIVGSKNDGSLFLYLGRVLLS